MGHASHSTHPTRYAGYITIPAPATGPGCSLFPGTHGKHGKGLAVCGCVCVWTSDVSFARQHTNMSILISCQTVRPTDRPTFGLVGASPLCCLQWGQQGEMRYVRGGPISVLRSTYCKPECLSNSRCCTITIRELLLTRIHTIKKYQDMSQM